MQVRIIDSPNENPVTKITKLPSIDPPKFSHRILSSPYFESPLKNSTLKIGIKVIPFFREMAPATGTARQYLNELLPGPRTSNLSLFFTSEEPYGPTYLIMLTSGIGHVPRCFPMDLAHHIRSSTARRSPRSGSLLEPRSPRYRIDV